MGIVADLVANAGFYIGKDTVAGTDHVGAARVQITVLPGAAGVSLDYEIFNALAPGPIMGHIEHTIIGSTDAGDTIMLIGHTHSTGLTLLKESEPGVFESDESSPFPMKVVVTVTAPGRIRHAWWYGPAGGEAIERDVSELELQS